MLLKGRLKDRVREGGSIEEVRYKVFGVFGLKGKWVDALMETRRRDRMEGHIHMSCLTYGMAAVTISICMTSY